MSIPLKVGSITYNFPQTTDEGWGTDVTNWALAITQNALMKAGGTFALTAPLNFGPNFGLVAKYYQSLAGSVVTTGEVRLANSDTIVFRNAGNTANLAFGTGSTNAIPQYNGIDLVNLSTSQTLTNKTLTGAILNSPTITGLLFNSITITSSILTSNTVNDKLNFGTAIFDAMALVAFTLADNISSPTPVFTFALPGNENIVVEYSIKRNGIKEIGNMFITSDGSIAQVALGSLNLASTGIVFTADVNTGTVRLLYTSTNTGVSGTMKYLTRRWAD